MKNIIFLVLAIVVFSCNKKDDPKPDPVVKDAPVGVLIASSGFPITKVRYKIRAYADSNTFTYKTFDFSSYVNSNGDYTNALPLKVHYSYLASFGTVPYTTGYYFSDTTTFDKGVLQGVEVTTQTNTASGNSLNLHTWNSSTGGSSKSYDFTIRYDLNYATGSRMAFQDSTTFKIPK